MHCTLLCGEAHRLSFNLTVVADMVTSFCRLPNENAASYRSGMGVNGKNENAL